MISKEKEKNSDYFNEKDEQKNIDQEENEKTPLE